MLVIITCDDLYVLLLLLVLYEKVLCIRSSDENSHMHNLGSIHFSNILFHC